MPTGKSAGRLSCFNGNGGQRNASANASTGMFCRPARARCGRRPRERPIAAGAVSVLWLHALANGQLGSLVSVRPNWISGPAAWLHDTAIPLRVCMSQDSDYFRARAEAERALAKSAEQIKAAAIHNDLADRYDELVRKAEPRAKVHIAAPMRPA